MNFQRGTILRLNYNGIEMKVTFISEDQGFVTVKLNNGYNITVRGDTLDIIEVIERKGEKKQTTHYEQGEGIPISLITTGGTIVSAIDYNTGAVHPSTDIRGIVSRYPYMEEKYRITVREFDNILSENMHPSMWVNLAKMIKKSWVNPEALLYLMVRTPCLIRHLHFHLCLMG
ncbi:Asparaginase/glutaminase [mine drainage metagenome]|uniref:Asparaginase/glutaminase n=1 Tax=mine drainage metagenome TaxID=410659 RepID=T1D1N7_9ZZZZ